MRQYFILFIVAFLLRFGMACYWEAKYGGLYFGDSETYWQLGKSIAAGKPYVFDAQAIHRMPGYPVLLSPLFLLGVDSIFLARLENVFIGTITVMAVSWLAFLLFRDHKIALLSGWFTAIDPLNIVTSVLILSETPFCLAMILQLAFWCKFFRNEKSGKSLGFFYLVLSGIASSAAVYFRPSWLLFIPFASIVGLILATFSHRQFYRIFVSGIIISLVCAAGLSPWWIRNYKVSGHFVATTLQLGPSLYDGLHENATGGSNMDFIGKFREDEKRENKEASKLLPISIEYSINRKLQEAAINWTWNHPKQAMTLAQTKFFRLWNFFPNEPAFSSLSVRTVIFCTYMPVIILALCGIIRSFWYDYSIWLLWIPALYITGLHIVFVSSIRYRSPAMLTLAILAAWFVIASCKRHFRGAQ